MTDLMASYFFLLMFFTALVSSIAVTAIVVLMATHAMFGSARSGLKKCEVLEMAVLFVVYLVFAFGAVLLCLEINNTRAIIAVA